MFSLSDFLNNYFSAAVCPFETKRELKEGKRRRRYEQLDALYLMRPTKSNLERVCEDFKREVEENKRDLLERLFPCIFAGIPDLVQDPPMYKQARLLFLPGPQVQDDCANWQFAHRILENLIDSKKEYAPLADAWFKPSIHECPVEFLAYESSLFSVDIPDALSKLHSHHPNMGRDDDTTRVSVTFDVFIVILTISLFGSCIVSIFSYCPTFTADASHGQAH